MGPTAMDKILFENETPRTVKNHLKMLEQHLRTAKGYEREVTISLIKIKMETYNLIKKK